MRRVVYFFIGLVIWLLLTWSFNYQYIIAGIVASALVAVVFHDVFPKEHIIFTSPVRMFWLLVYIPVFFYYIIKAEMPIKPGIVKIKTNLKTDSGITALANSITLTPGTLTVDLTDDGYLYIHWINVRSDNIEEATKDIAQKFEFFLTKIFE